MRIIFMGTPRFAVPILEALVEAGHQMLVVTQSDKAAGRDRRLRYSQVKLAALKFGLPVYQPERVSSPAALETLGGFQPELIVLAAYGQILRASVLKLPPLGCLNVHPSLLPRYRGATPIPAAIMAGETETGVTVIRMDEGMDTGDILAQRRLPIAADDTSESLGEKLARLGASLLLQTIPAWARGEIVPVPQ
ncbi:MAG: methionyl-tRNA formyltransferase, partial [Chloroflexota bacterium]